MSNNTYKIKDKRQLLVNLFHTRKNKAPIIPQITKKKSKKYCRKIKKLSNKSGIICLKFKSFKKIWKESNKLWKETRRGYMKSYLSMNEK